ncbi:MAG: AAA family ATPase [Deltaproteobacteria bacterium]|nr:AAA family ATPase [Deltaproteobacteria bacterium]MBW2319653.1 AAA family ATPase [Deltaproteobacteria bacterium]
MTTALAKEEQGCLDFLGLYHNPFPVVPEEENFYFSEHIQKILTEIIFGVHARKGFMVLTGEVGLGKTTISRRIINLIEEKGVETSLVFYTGFKDVELIRGINRDFGLTADSLLFSDQMQLLYDFLVEKNRCGKNCTIIIDDAQNLDFKSLELIRMISNLETSGEKLVQILLVGQPELIHLLDSKELRQLRSRIVIQQEVKALTPEELKDYLYFKLNLAGNRGHIRIQKTALNKIYKLTQGNFRQVNLLMDRCLYVAFLHNTLEINRKIVVEAFVDLHPKKLKLLKKPLTLMASIFIVLSLFGGMVYSGFSRDISSTSSNIKTYATPKDNSDRLELGPAKQALQITDLNLDKEPNDLGQHSVIPESVINFLDEYKLSNYRDPFFEALETGRFQELTEEIFEKTGYMLVRLDYVSDHIQNAYGTLRYVSNLIGHQQFYLFWRPPLIFTKFYYYYQGEEILKLQKMMAKINLYSGLLDGIVGKKLMLAVVNYQEQAGLSVTGYPDEKTIFLLCHELENLKNET